MTSVPAAMYWCCIYLTGEWANVDFTYAGSRLCILYVIFGIAMFSIPVGIIVESVKSGMEALEFERADMKMLVTHTKQQLLRPGSVELSDMTTLTRPPDEEIIYSPPSATEAQQAGEKVAFPPHWGV